MEEIRDDECMSIELLVVEPVDLDHCKKCGEKLEFIGFWRDPNGWIDVPAWACPDCYLKNRGKR